MLARLIKLVRYIRLIMFDLRPVGLFLEYYQCEMLNLQLADNYNENNQRNGQCPFMQGLLIIKRRVTVWLSRGTRGVLVLQACGIST